MIVQRVVYPNIMFNITKDVNMECPKMRWRLNGGIPVHSFMATNQLQVLVHNARILQARQISDLC